MANTGGKPFGKYILQERIAMGGMAEIFRAHRKGAQGFTKDVVIKRIHKEFNNNTEFIQMFINEAKIASLLSHPNIVQIIDFDQTNKMYYIAMELIRGFDLQKVMQLSQKNKQTFPVQLAIFIAIQLLKGLAYAHETKPKSIIHRDISPQNVMLSLRGEVKITDFGIAKATEQARKTASGMLQGKVNYMSPEQTQTSRINHRSDLFSLGVVLWELLANQTLFHAKNDVLALSFVREKPIIPPHEINPTVSADLSKIVMWSLKRNTAERIPNAHIFSQKLKLFLTLAHPEDHLSQYLQKLSNEKNGKLLTENLDISPGIRARNEKKMTTKSFHHQTTQTTPDTTSTSSSEKQKGCLDLSTPFESTASYRPRKEKALKDILSQKIVKNNKEQPRSWLTDTVHINPKEHLEEYTKHISKEKTSQEAPDILDTVAVNPAKLLSNFSITPPKSLQIEKKESTPTPVTNAFPSDQKHGKQTHQKRVQKEEKRTISKTRQKTISMNETVALRPEEHLTSQIKKNFIVKKDINTDIPTQLISLKKSPSKQSQVTLRNSFLLKILFTIVLIFLGGMLLWKGVL